MGMFDHLKKQKTIEYKKTFKRFVIVGQDWAALNLFNFLSDKFSKDEILIIDSKDLSQDHLFFPGPSVNRGEVSKEILERFLGSDNEVRLGEEALFYKDQKLRSFRDRMKPFELLYSEPYFKERPLYFNQENLLEKKQSYEEVSQCFKKTSLKSIECCLPQDLIEQSFFKVFLPNHEEIQCEYLFFGGHPKDFLNILEKNDHINSEFISTSSHIKNEKTLIVEYLMPSGTITPGTYFIPQSQTHDWGHFVIEIKDCANGQILKSLCHFPSDDISEEEISKKIKLLKRSLERVFESFNGDKYHEKIWFLDMKPFDALSGDNLTQPKNFSYFGWYAPIDANYFKENNFHWDQSLIFNDARSLLSLKQIQQNF